MSKVLITGINGFVGVHLVAELQSKNWSVFGLSRDGDGELKNEVVLLKGDILDKDALYKTINEVKPDAIFHLAAQSKPFESFKKPEETINVNLIGTLHMLEIVESMHKKGHSCRLMLVGSGEEYGSVVREKLPICEDTPLNPSNPYSISKAAGYFLARQYAKSGLDVVYLSPFSHIGVGQGVGFLIPDVCKQIVDIEHGEKDPVVVTGDLSAEKDFCDVRDVVCGYLALLEKGDRGERYNICSGVSVRVGSLVEALLAKSHVKIEHKIDENRKRIGEVVVMRGDNAKIRKTTGWDCKIPIDTTLNDCLNWWRDKTSSH